MMDWTDRHERYFLRQITKKSLLYTEMITSGAILFGDRDRHLAFNLQEHPVSVQLGGSNTNDLAECAKICEDYGYDEINLNVGCPSDRVQSGKIGACLMAEPQLVADCLSAMNKAVKIPVTIKHRLGIDDFDSYEYLHRFVDTVAQSGCKTFIVHARKAVLNGLSPKQNRQVPPLIYARVYQLKQDFPKLEIILNGGVNSLDEVETHLQKVDGVMLGRQAYQNPFILADVDSRFYSEDIEEQSVDVIKKITRQEVVQSILPYIQSEMDKGTRLQHIVRHILGLFHGQPNGKLWRRYLSENAHKENAKIDVVEKALNLVM